jgi:hypothetical protein
LWTGLRRKSSIFGSASPVEIAFVGSALPKTLSPSASKTHRLLGGFQVQETCTKEKGGLEAAFSSGSLWSG